MEIRWNELSPSGRDLTNSLQAMALWQPANGFRKGGIGAYQMQNDFKNDCYKYFRAAINAMDKLEKGGTEADDQQ